jgi:uncharacterized membrane protein YsdA (DUF1294 family)/cold shock CspA family protein
MKNKGTLQDWDDEKGFGFIRSDEGNAKVFAHIHDFKSKHPRPRNGDGVDYQTRKDERGRLKAVAISRPGVEKSKSSFLLPLILILGFAVWIGIQTRIRSYPKELPIALGVLSLISYVQYARDKRLAKRHAFRIPEARLHFIDLLGGWPGGWIAQKRYRHKVSKAGFQAVFAITIVLNVGVLMYLAAKPGYWENGKYGDYIPALLNRMERHLEGDFDFQLKSWIPQRSIKR